MKIRFNGDARDVPSDCTVLELLRRVQLHDAVCAVAVNGSFVPRGEHDRAQLHPDDAVEVVAPMQGG